MNAIIELAATEPYWRPDARYWNLLHGLMAIHNPLSHDEDKITFCRDDGLKFYVNLAVSYASFGPTDGSKDEQFWVDNIERGQMFHLLMLFTDRRDEELKMFDWMGRPV